MLRQKPDDTFLLYGIAQEHKKANRIADAIAFFDKVIQLDPGYCYAYHQKGLTHEQAGSIDAAKQAYRDGIAAARKKGDQHAQQEIEAALSLLE